MLEERLERDMRAALKAGEQTRLSTLRMLRSQRLAPFFRSFGDNHGPGDIDPGAI